MFLLFFYGHDFFDRKLFTFLTTIRILNFLFQSRIYLEVLRYIKSNFEHVAYELL